MYQVQYDSQKNMPTSSATNGVRSSRMLFNIEHVRRVEGPMYNHAPNDSWGDLTRGLKECRSLKDAARKVYAEIEREKSTDVKSKSKTAQYHCNCKQTNCPSINSPKSSLAVILNVPGNKFSVSVPATW
jgi:hypothetical protein